MQSMQTQPVNQFFNMMQDNMQTQSPLQKKTYNKFTLQEDQKILDLVKIHGTNNWTQIAEKIPKRTPRQIRERWTNYLDPNINHSEFTAEEDQIIIEKYNEIGSKWSNIAKFMGRTENQVKNRFYSHILPAAKRLNILLTKENSHLLIEETQKVKRKRKKINPYQQLSITTSQFQPTHKISNQFNLNQLQTPSVNPPFQSHTISHPQNQILVPVPCFVPYPVYVPVQATPEEQKQSQSIYSKIDEAKKKSDEYNSQIQQTNQFEFDLFDQNEQFGQINDSFYDFNI
jgi:Myb superfamily proteins, including transcription factors and mRNA splicing factors